MLPVTRHINQLLFEVDCVIVPGLGGFVANYHPALLNRGTGLIEPPSKGLIFNKNLVVNDGLLANAIAQAEQISYAEANSLIEEFVTEARQLISQGNRIEIPDVGFLYADHEQNLRFQPLYSVNFLKDSFGLTPVIANVVRTTAVTESIKLQPELEEGIVQLEYKQDVRQKQKERKPIQEDIREEKTVTLNPRSKRWYWAAAVLLPLAFYSVWIPARTDFLESGYLRWSDLNPFHKTEPSNYKVRAYISNFEITESNKTTDSLDFSHLTIVHHVHKTEVETTYVHKYHADAVSSNFHLIAGCFQSKENALNQVAILKGQGLDAYLFGMSGQLYRVAVGSFETKQQALQRLSELRAAGKPGVWLLTE